MDKRTHRTWIIINLIGLMFIGAFVAVVLVDRSQQAERTPPEGVESFSDLSRNHVEGTVSYPQNPPGRW